MSLAWRSRQLSSCSQQSTPSLALQFHPDKVSRSGLSDEAASRKFQQVSFAFGVLSNEGRRRRFDATGRTDELVFGDDGNVDWDEYFATLWQGEVSGQSLKEYKKNYQRECVAWRRVL